MKSESSIRLFFRIFFITSFYYAATFVLLQLFSYLFLGGTWLLNRDALLGADAEHYYYISQHGYEGFRVAFFPLFPLFWNIIGGGIYLIVFVNSLLFLLSFSALASMFKIEKPLEICLLASVPCFIFMFVPYTEAIFFMSGTLLLIGLKKDIDAFTCIGVLLCGIARPSAAVFIPALLLTVILGNKSKEEKIKKSILYCASALAGFGITLLIQHSYTGEWFSFFEAQKGWGNQLRIPEFPFKSWSGGKIVRLDASALLVGFFAFGFLLTILYKKLKRQKCELSPDIIFSISYLAGISLLILAFRGGSFFSLNRFVYATPFFLAALVYFMRNYSFTVKQIGIFFLISSMFWLLFGSYVHIQYLLKFELLSWFLATYFLLNSKNENLKKISFALILTVNTVLLMYFYYRYLSNDWVG